MPHTIGPDDTTVKSSPFGDLQLPEGKQISLYVVAGPDKGKHHPCTQPRVALGRHQVDFPLSDPEVSQLHCVIEVRDQQVMLRDLGSKNGTFVGDRSIRQAELTHLSEFRLGQTTVALLISAVDE
jgi:predicted component of type VI protein secretion system